MRTILHVIGLLSFLYLLISFGMSTYINSSARMTWYNMHKEEFKCPDGTDITYRGWSEGGRQRYCEPVKNGPWEAWMSGYKWVEGSYKSGKKHGVWKWFDESGNVTKSIRYANGKELQAEAR